MSFRIFAAVLLILFAIGVKPAYSHPHVFLETNLEIVKDEKDRVTEIRQVWRFDELFSTSVVFDFDKNGDSQIDADELIEIETTIKKNLKDFDYYTAIRLDDEVIEFDPPTTFLADFENHQMIIIVGFRMKKPIGIKGKKFSVSISDPTYYVAVEIADEGSIIINDDKKACKHEIVRPDFDALYEKNPQVFSDDFQGSDDPNIFSADEYLTWVNFNCA